MIPQANKKPEELEAFHVEERVLNFLSENEKVLLIQGGGGSGKSLFCHIFAKNLVDEGKMEWIPVFISLPALKNPVS